MSNAQTLTVADMTVRQDDAGRYNLNDLHKAAGGRKTDQPSNFLRMDETLLLIDELANSSDLRSSIQPVKKKPGRYGGTFVVKELVYQYAMWISPQFNLKVIRAFDRLQQDGVAVAEHAADDLLDNPLDYMEKLLGQAKQLKAERDAYKNEAEVKEKYLTFLPVQRYESQTERYLSPSQKTKLGKRATKLAREMNVEIGQEERQVKDRKNGEMIDSYVNVYPIWLLEEAEGQLLAAGNF